MLGTVFLLVGTLLIAIWFYLRKKAASTAQWPSAKGRMVAADIVRTRDSDDVEQQEFRVAYDFSVSGVTWRGARVSLTGSGAGSAKAKLARYPAGAEVDVFYNPKDPASAVLERKLPGNVWVLLIVGSVFLIFGVLALFY